MLIRRLLTLGLGVYLLGSVAQAASAPARIGCWGDSLTFGTGAPAGTSYPTALKKLLPGSTIFNGGIAGETSPQIAGRFFADPNDWGDFTVIWAGRNNYSETTQVLADVADMVAALPAPKRFVVLSVTTADFPDEYIGQSGYNLIRSLNLALQAAYPANFIDIQTFLWSQYDPRNAHDLKDHANGILPSSLRSDEIHLTARGYALVAQRVARFIMGARVSP